MTQENKTEYGFLQEQIETQTQAYITFSNILTKIYMILSEHKEKLIHVEDLNQNNIRGFIEKLTELEKEIDSLYQDFKVANKETTKEQNIHFELLTKVDNFLKNNAIVLDSVVNNIEKINNTNTNIREDIQKFDLFYNKIKTDFEQNKYLLEVHQDMQIIISFIDMIKKISTKVMLIIGAIIFVIAIAETLVQFNIFRIIWHPN